MCIMLTQPEASKTQLFNVPVVIDNENFIMSLYINNITNNKSGCFMVVPYPLVSKNNIALVDVSTEIMKTFRKNVESYCSGSQRQLSFSTLSKSLTLEVYNVGNYKISIANNLQQLLNNVDWNIFEKPQDFNERIRVFGDKNIYPFECMYIVAQTTKNIKNDGFGIIYKNDNFSYFPTAHEYNYDGNDYDVICYDLCKDCNNFRTHTKYTNFVPAKMFFADSLNNVFEIDSYIDEKYNLSLNDICDKIRNTEHVMLDGRKVNLKIDRLNKVNTVKIKGKYSNSNIIYKH